MDNHGKGVGLEGLMCSVSNDWSPLVKRFAIPPDTAQLNFQLRLQNSTGFVDWDDVEITFVDSLEADVPQQPVARVQPAEDMALQEITRFELKHNEKGQWILDNGTLQLTNQAPVEPKTQYPILGFQLPAQYCDDPRLVYDMQMQFVPQWGSQDNQPHAVFQVGHNIYGQEPDSMGVMIWKGKTLISRLSPSIGAEQKTEVLLNDLKVASGQTYTIRTKFAGNSVEAYWNNTLINTKRMVNTAIWPKAKLCFVGGESIGSAPLNARIDSFVLRVLVPKLQVNLQGDQQWGCFVSNTPNQTKLDFPNLNGQSCTTQFSITDIDNKLILEDHKPISRSAGAHTLELPALKPGWYRFKAQVKSSDATVNITRSFVCLPADLQSADAPDSPFGITEEITMTPGQYDPKLTELLFANAQKMGIRWWRLWLGWDQVEPNRGQFDWAALDDVVTSAQRHGVKLYVCLLGGKNAWQSVKSTLTEPLTYGLMSQRCYMPLNMDDWSNYLTAISRRYQDKITAYQIWNEPDARNGFYPFDPAAYTQLLAVSAHALRAVDPEIRIGMGGICAAYNLLDKHSHTLADNAWGLPEFYKTSPQPFYDVLDFHFYSMSIDLQRWEPQVPMIQGLQSYLARQAEGHKPMWNSETCFIASPEGTMAYHWSNSDTINQKQQMARLVQWYALSLATGIERNFWYGLRGDNGLAESDFAPKPAFAAHAVLADKLNGMSFLNAPLLSDNLRLCQFVNSDKTRYLSILWSVSGQELVSCTLQDSTSPIRIDDLFGNPLQTSGHEGIITAMDQPVYVQSAAPITFSPIIDAQLPDTPTADQPLAVRCTVTNPAAVPSVCRVVATMGSHQALQESFTIPAHSQLVRELVISPATSGLLRLDMALSGGINQRTLIERHVKMHTVVSLADQVEKTFAINQLKQVCIGAQTLDAQNRELTPSHWDGPDDLSAVLSISRQSSQFNFQIQVTDNKVVIAPAHRPVYEGDAVELFIDMRTLDKPEASQYFQVICSPDGRLWQAGGKQLPGLAIKAVRTDSGYRMTGSFPVTDASLASLGFDVSLDDADDASGRKVQMVWAGNENNHSNPNQWAKIRFNH
jgi:hypothetical protein